MYTYIHVYHKYKVSKTNLLCHIFKLKKLSYHIIFDVIVSLLDELVNGHKLMARGLYPWPLETIGKLSVEECQIMERCGFIDFLQMP